MDHAFEHSALALSEQKYKAVWDCAADAMAFLDHEGLLDCNEAGLRLFGLAEREMLLGHPLSTFAPPTQPHGATSRDYIAAQVGAALASGQSRFECQLRRSDGSLFVADIRLHRIPIGGGHAAHAVFRDITVRWETEQRLRSAKDAIEASLHQLAFFDTVTALPNRAQFQERAQLALGRAEAAGRPMALASIAIDNLSHINNSLGFDAGDAALREIAARLVAAVQAADIVARVSGNVFGILFDGCNADNAGRAIQPPLAAAADPVDIGSHQVTLSLSAGIGIFGTDGSDLWTLMQNAETAMYRAKAGGTGSFQFYSGDMNTVALERLVLENSLRRALEHGEFVLHYQPLIAASDGRIIGVEALVRWQHPDIGLLLPDRFVPLAEQSGLIIPIGEWVLGEACRQARAWQLAGLPPIEMGVNLSPRQFHKPDLKEKVAAVLAQSALDPALLVLELTEGALMDHTEQTLRTLTELRAMGVRLAVDDFGTGYSSLAYLKRFPLDKLKVDKSFVRALGDSDDDVVIAQAIINLGRDLRLEVVAEGIETLAELEALRSYGCEYMQGYHFSRAVPAAEVEALLRAAASDGPRGPG